jgi:hypothetical protein
MDSNEYKLKDFYLSCCLLASKLTLNRLEPIGGGFVYFVFNDPERIAESIISQHWNRTNRIPSRDLVEAINELRSRLHNDV